MSRADELRALADAATPGPWAYELIERGPAQVGLVWDDDDEPLSGAIGPDDGTVIEPVAEVERGDDARLIALAPSLARDHAALLDWAARAAEMLVAVDAVLFDAKATYGTHCAACGPEAWMTPMMTERAPLLDALGITELRPGTMPLLAEWAEMQERPS